MNKIPKSLRRPMIMWLISGGALILFLIGTDPLKLPLPLVLLPFAIFFVWVRSMVIILGMAPRRPASPSKKLKVVASSVAAVFLLVVTLQSLGQLSWRDILLVLSLVIGLGIYFYKTDLI